MFLKLFRKYKPPTVDDIDFFADRIGIGYTDFNSLSIEEADRQLRNIEESNSQISKEDWKGYKEISSRKYDELFLKALAGKNAAETHKWFMSQKLHRINMSSNVWKQVSIKVGPLHEKYLLKQLKNVAPENVKEWVSSMKSNGYFFTTKVYNSGLDKFCYRK